MVKLIFLFVFLISGSLIAQIHDTILYTSHWKKTTLRDSAAFYSVLEPEGILTRQTIYYVATSQMERTGTLSQIDPQIMEGLFKFYNIDGKLETEGYFLHNVRQGEWKWFYPSGILSHTENYVNGVADGMVVHYDEKGKTMYRHIYKNGKHLGVASFERDMKQGFLIRGKAAGFFFIEDLWFFNFTAGVEYRFAENHAFGIDYYFFRFRDEQEQYPNGNTQDYVEYSSYRPRSSILIDYRFYFDQSVSRKRSVIPYFQLYGRVGKARTYHQAEYKVDSAGVFRQWETFYDLGATFGMHFAFFPEGKLGFDVCAGAYRREKLEDIEHYEPGGPNWFEYDKVKIQWLPIVRVNLFYYLWGEKTITRMKYN